MITRLLIKNFRSIATAEIPPDKVNFFVGPEESGKTTIAESLRVALAAHSRWSDGKGTGLLDQIRDGQKLAEIVLELEDGTTIARTIPTRGNAPEVRWSPEVVDACLSNRLIFEEKDSDQKDLLAGVVTKMTKSKVFGLLADWTPEFPDLAEWWEREHLAKAGRKLGEWFEYAQEARRLAKADLKASQARFDALGGKTAPSRPSLEVIDKLRAEYQAALKLLATEEERAQAAGEDTASAHVMWSRTQERKAALEKLIETTEAELTEAKKERSAIRVARASDLLKEDLNLSRQDMDADSQEMKALLAETADCLEGQCARRQIREINARLTKKREVFDKAQTKYREAVEKEIRAQGFSVREESAAKRLAEYRLEVESLTSSPEPTRPQRKDLTALHQQVEDCKDAIWSYEERQRAWDLFSLQQTERESLKSEIEVLEEELRRWEALADAKRGAFAPSGIKARILDEQFGAFEERLNAAMKPLGFEFHFQAEPWEISFSSPCSKMRPAKFHSHSAQARACAGLQAQLAIESGLGIIAVDEHGMGPIERKRFMDFLLSLPVQSFVFTTLQNAVNGKIAYPVAPDIEGVRVFHLRNGSVTQA